MPRKTKPKPSCGACARSVPLVTNRNFIGHNAIGLCDDCNLEYDHYCTRVLTAMGESAVRLDSILREWVRECRAHHGTKPYTPKETYEDTDR